MSHRQTDIPFDNGAEPRHLAALPRLPRPLYGRIHSLPNQAIGEPHHHPWAQLSHALSGTVRVETRKEHFLAPAGHAVWVPAGVVHAVSCSPGTVIRSLYIEPTAMPAPRTTCGVIGVSPLLRELIRTFGEFPTHYDAEGAEGRLVAVLLDRLSIAPDLGLTLPWPTDPRLQTLCQHLQRHPDDRLSLSEHALRLGISDRTLSRWFLSQTGLSFRQWRRRCRVLSTLPALERGERVTDVALSCGYDSLSAFIAAFHEQLGAPPSRVFRDRR